jgi:hypothetical protein
MAVHFSVDTKLTRLLGETYRSSEVALKELVDNAWDADARNVVIALPDPLSSESIVVQDDGAGMTALELRGEYLNIASDKRSRILELYLVRVRPHAKRGGAGSRRRRHGDLLADSGRARRGTTARAAGRLHQHLGVRHGRKRRRAVPSC